MRGFRGGGGWGSRPLENLKIIGFLWNTGPDPLENHKATSNVMPSSARLRNAIKWRFAGGLMMAHF